MGRAMTSVARSEATAAPVAAPERKRAPSVARRSLPEGVLAMQRAAGNAAVARSLARPAKQSLQRCGANCTCSSCGGHSHDDELLEDEKLGAGLLRSAVARRSA
jgi:hypothetical protein